MITLHHFKHLSIRADRKREGVSLASALFAWFAILASASALLLVCAAYAYYTFTTIDTPSVAVAVEATGTISYNKSQVDAALERYRTKKVYIEEKTGIYRANLPQPVAIPIEPAADAPTSIGDAPVASPAEMRVE